MSENKIIIDCKKLVRRGEMFWCEKKHIYPNVLMCYGCKYPKEKRGMDKWLKS